MGGERKTRRRTRRPGRLTRQQKALIAVAAVLAVALVGVLAWKSVFVRPDLPGEEPREEGKAEELDWGEGLRPHSGGERKSKDYYTVLILGRDTGGGGNTDTMLLASYDVTNQRATVMSIPRDTMVNIPYDVKKINGVYNYGGGGEAGIEYLYKEISQLVGFEPDFQVVIEWEAVGEIVDAMDGVWFDVPRNMNYDDPYQDLHIHQEKGYRLLSGDDAMQVLRYRHDNDMRYGYPEGDLGRIKTQQALLKAMVEQLLKLENITKIKELIRVFEDNVETDLTFQNILWFAQSAVFGGLSIDSVEFITMPYRNADAWSRVYGQDLNYVVPVADELLDLVNDRLSPYTKVFALSDLDIMSVNADGSVSSSTGHVEDTKATYPRSHWQVQEEPEEEETPPAEEGGGSAVTDPETGESVTPGGGTADPGTGGEATDPGTGGETATPDTGGETTTDPGTGETGGTPDAGGQPSGGETTDPGTDSGTVPTAPDEGFIIMG